MSDGVHHDHIPGPSGKPLVGNTVEFGSDPSLSSHVSPASTDPSPATRPAASSSSR
ncbi:hypothetical protein [Halospeciosus flavus]|uniref:hypothetical protein n=1 Tax=Halospeciosus flavus TaxID=3032283 RepID=UPI00360B0555